MPGVRSARRRRLGVNTVRTTAFTPASISGLLGWWDASTLGLADGTAVASWPDSSGNGKDMTNATGSQQPLAKTGANGINGKSVVLFDGVDDRLVSSLTATTLPVTVIAVAKVTDVAAVRTLVGASGSQGLQFRVQTTRKLEAVKEGAVLIGSSTGLITTGQASVMSMTYASGGALAFFLDGAASGTATNAQTFSASTVSLGANLVAAAAELLSGSLGEVLIYNSVLSGTDRPAVEAYLKTKWGTA